MSDLENLLQSVSAALDGSIDYAAQLKSRGYRTPEGILAALSAEELGSDCGLLIGDARVIWRAAGGMTGERYITLPLHSVVCLAVHQLIQSIMAHEPGSTILACIGQLRLSMEGRQRTRCLHPGASQQGKLLADGFLTPGHACTDPCRPGRACLGFWV